MPRRNFLKYGVTAAVAAVVAGVGGFLAGTAQQPQLAPTASAPTVTVTAPPPSEKKPWRIGWIGAFDSDMGKSALRFTQMAVEDVNAVGGILGRPLELVSTDAKEDVEEAIKGYEFLAETAKVDVIISSDIDDDTMGWMPRLAEFDMPTMESWTSAIRAIELVRDDYDKYKHYFMPHTNDFQLGAGMIEFAKDFIVKKLGLMEAVLFQEDTTYGAGTAEFVTQEVAPAAGFGIVDHIVYDVDTPDFSPLYDRAVRSGGDFLFQIASVRDLVPAAQYVELNVPLPLFGIVVSAFSQEFWEDTGGRAEGITVLQPNVSPFGKMDKLNQTLTERYQKRWPSRPVIPHFNAYNCYHSLWMVKETAERAGGLSRSAPGEPIDRSIVDAWVEEMEKIHFITGYLNDDFPGEQFRFFKPGEKDPVTDHESTHGCYVDLTGKTGKAIPWHQWQPDKTAHVIWPDRYKTAEFWLRE